MLSGTLEGINIVQWEDRAGKSTVVGLSPGQTAGYVGGTYVQRPDSQDVNTVYSPGTGSASIEIEGGASGKGTKDVTTVRKDQYGNVIEVTKQSSSGSLIFQRKVVPGQGLVEEGLPQDVAQNVKEIQEQKENIPQDRRSAEYRRMQEQKEAKIYPQQFPGITPIKSLYGREALPISRERLNQGKFVTLPFYRKTEQISKGLQTRYEGAIGYKGEESHPIKKAASGFGSVFTGLPQFIGAGVVGAEVVVKEPMKAPGKFVTGLSVFEQDISTSVQTKPFETVGMGLGMLAFGRIAKGKVSKTPYYTKEVTGFKVESGIKVKANEPILSTMQQKVTPILKNKIEFLSQEPKLTSLENTPFKVGFSVKTKTGSIKRIESGEGIFQFKKGNLVQGDFGGVKRIPDRSTSLIKPIGTVKKVTPLDKIILNVSKKSPSPFFSKSNKLSGSFTGKVSQKMKLNILKDRTTIDLVKKRPVKLLTSGYKQLKSAGIVKEVKSKIVFKTKGIKSNINKTKFKAGKILNTWQRRATKPLKIKSELEFKLSKIKTPGKTSAAFQKVKSNIKNPIRKTSFTFNKKIGMWVRRPGTFDKPITNFKRFLKSDRAEFIPQKQRQTIVKPKSRRLTVIDRPTVLPSLQNLRVSSTPIRGTQYLPNVKTSTMLFRPVKQHQFAQPVQKSNVQTVTFKSKPTSKTSVFVETIRKNRPKSTPSTGIKIFNQASSKTVPKTTTSLLISIKTVFKTSPLTSPKTLTKSKLSPKLKPKPYPQPRPYPRPQVFTQLKPKIKIPKRRKQDTLFQFKKSKSQKKSSKFKEFTGVLLPSQILRGGVR